MRKRMVALVLAVLVMTLNTLSVSSAQTFGEDTFEITPEVRAKLHENLVERLFNVSDDELFDVTVDCDQETGPDFVHRARESVENLQATDELSLFKMFRVNVTRSQLLQLAELPFVTRIEENRMDHLLCLNSARGPLGANVDALRDLYPEMDGDMDGNTEVYSKDDVVIAVLDTGIDPNHYDLDGGKIIGWKDIIFGFHNPYDDSEEGHGTLCASIAAGSGDADWDYRGVAPYAALVGVKMGLGDGRILYPWWPLAALEWVTIYKYAYGIDIVSCSWGQPGWGYDLVALYMDMMVTAQGLIICVAAGNYDPEDPTTRYVFSPGTAHNVITVGASADGFGRWPASSWGDPDYEPIKPDVLAPGVDIWAAKRGTQDDYWPGTGTSAAAPFVAGLAGLFFEYLELRGIEADCGPRLKHLFMASAVELPDDDTPGKDRKNGAGMVEALDIHGFWTNDISSSYWNARFTLGSSWEDQDWPWYDEPMWVYDGEDWYSLMCFIGIFIYVEVWGDPDLVARIYILDQARNVLTYSYPKRNPSRGWTTTYEGVYYVKITVEEFSGDYYDIMISTTAS